MDLDLTAGTVSFALRATHHYSVIDALRHADKLDKGLWSALAKKGDGMDLLLAPEKPEVGGSENHRIGDVLEFARGEYDFVIVDLPSVYDRMAQVALRRRRPYLSDLEPGTALPSSDAQVPGLSRRDGPRSRAVFGPA